MSSKVPTVIDSVKYYKGSGYRSINKLLREVTVPSIDKISSIMRSSYPDIQHVINIDSFMYNNGSLKGKIIYRGIYNLEGLIKTQDVLVNTAYSSSSFSIDTAHNFIKAGCCIIAFTVPDEIKYIDYADIIKKDSEIEVLIQRNTQFVNIKKHSTHKGRPIYTGILKLYASPIITDKDVKNLNRLDTMLRNID